MIARTTREVGAFLRERRRAKGWDQAELANQIGVSRHWVLAIEKGGEGAEIGLVLRALRALDVDLRLEATQPATDDPLAAALERTRRRNG